MEQSTLQAVRQAELEAAQAESAAAKQCQELIDQGYQPCGVCKP